MPIFTDYAEQGYLFVYCRDILNILFGYLSMMDACRFSRSCKLVYNFYNTLVFTSKSKSKFSKTLLFDYQVKIRDWMVENALPGERLLCQSYMSSGKTLIGYETCFDFLDKRPIQGFALVIAPRSCVNTWEDEAKKHYNNYLGKQILFYMSVNKSSRDIDAIEGSLKQELNGKIVVSTPHIVSHRLTTNASIIIVDEAHRLADILSQIENERKKTPMIFMTASEKYSTYITKKYTLYDRKQNFPTMRYSFHDNTNINHLFRDISSKKDKYITVLTIHQGVIDPNELSRATSKKVFNFYNKQKTHYKMYEKEGGILVSTIKKVAEGVNFNLCSLIYIVNPVHVTMNSIQQTLGRVNRQTNVNSIVDVVFYAYKNTQIWARCKLSTISSRNLMGMDAVDGDIIDRRQKYLRSLGYDLDDLTDDEYILLYGKRILTADNTQNLDDMKLTHIKMGHMMQCMMDQDV